MVRTVDEGELAKLIADRAVKAAQDAIEGEREAAERQAFLFVQPAVRFLQDGRRREAAALFEALIDFDPDNPEAQNNLGFCLLPDDPERALQHVARHQSRRRRHRALSQVVSIPAI
jgi:Flp pilus assembly protein TadD